MSAPEESGRPDQGPEGMAGDMLFDLLRCASLVPDSFDPLDADCAAEANVHANSARSLLRSLERDTESYHALPIAYRDTFFGVRRPGYPPSRIDSLPTIAQSLQSPLSGVLWYTSECSIDRYDGGEQFCSPVIFSSEGLILEDPSNEDALVFHAWADLPYHEREAGTYSPKLVLMDADQNPVFSILPFERTLSDESFAMADVVLSRLLPFHRSGKGFGASPVVLWSAADVVRLVSAGDATVEALSRDLEIAQNRAAGSPSGDLLVDLLQIAGVWPADIDPSDRSFRGDLPSNVLAACEKLFSHLESDPDLWLEVPPDFGAVCRIIYDDESRESVSVDLMDELPLDGYYPWDSRGPLWYTSGITINSQYTGPMIFVRDGWIGVDPDDPTTLVLHGWDHFLDHTWPDSNSDGDYSESLMKLGDLELDFDTAGNPPWKALNLRLADILLRRILPAARRSLGADALESPPIGRWSVERLQRVLGLAAS